MKNHKPLEPQPYLVTLRGLSGLFLNQVSAPQMPDELGPDYFIWSGSRSDHGLEY